MKKLLPILFLLFFFSISCWADISTFVDTFNIGTGAVGSKVTRTGYGFQPKAILIFGSGDTSSTDTTAAGDVKKFVGMATSGSSERCIASWSQNGVTANSGTRVVATVALEIANGDGTLDGQASVDSLDSDGITFNIDDQFTNDVRVTVLAWGGTSITNAGIVTFALNTVTGDQDVTGFGFNSPDVVFIMGQRSTSAPASATDSTMSFGAGTGQNGGSPVSLVWMGGSNDAAATTVTASHCSGNNVYAIVNSSVASLTTRATYSGGITDGFRINLTAAAGTAFTVYAMAIKGGNWTIGESATRTDSNDIAITGLPSRPSGGLIIGSGNAETAASSLDTHDRWTMGAWDSISHRTTYGAFDESAIVGNSQTSKGVEHDEVYLNISTADAIDGLMDIKSVEATGETYVMDNADPSAVFFGYLTWGPAPSTQSVVPLISTINRRRR